MNLPALLSMDRRSRTIAVILGCLALFACVFTDAWLYGDRGEVTALTLRKLPPSLQYPFGTDWLGRDMLPHVLPQFMVGLLLLFPHAILHAAALTFLGFGMSPHTPAIGALLAESMRYLSMGLWWPAVAPGLTLVITVKAFDILGGNVRALLDPKTCRE